MQRGKKTSGHLLSDKRYVELVQRYEHAIISMFSASDKATAELLQQELADTRQECTQRIHNRYLIPDFQHKLHANRNHLLTQVEKLQAHNVRN